MGSRLRADRKGHLALKSGSKAEERLVTESKMAERRGEGVHFQPFPRTAIRTQALQSDRPGLESLHYMDMELWTTH